ncbi:hypothetical protein [uncultured Roseobacter sp.]|uniref:hypothetical protein n=1 Tax=uncultured Roseobacter sp. TaxID=114847 RepID=UPI00260E61A5|nr:hypothetical protein [uncultured Roseobacter sp.]
MAERALSEEAMLASLHDISLPAQAAGGLASDLAMTVGLAGVAALIVAGGLRALGRRARRSGPPDLKDRLGQLRDLPESQRRPAFLHLLRHHAPERYAQLARDLYHPRSALTSEALQAELERLV